MPPRDDLLSTLISHVHYLPDAQYIGAGKIMDMYSRKPLPIEDFRRTFLRWNSVRIAARREKHKPSAAEFQIEAVRRLIVGRG